MAVGKGSMDRASKAVKKTANPIVEPKVDSAVEIKEEITDKKNQNPIKEKKPVAKKTTVKKRTETETVLKEAASNEMIAIGEEMPIYYL